MQKCAEARKLAVKSPTERHILTSKRAGWSGKGRRRSDGSLMSRDSAVCAVLSLKWVISLTPEPRECPQRQNNLFSFNSLFNVHLWCVTCQFIP